VRRSLSLFATVALVSCGARSALELASDGGQPVARCGNHRVEPGEECDDGNAVDTDACVSSCRYARCGDGVVQLGEACDDGNLVDDDGCDTNCRGPSCPNGVVDHALEECDDGNGIDTDGCTSRCLLPRCGDGFVWAGVEECDLGPKNRDIPALLLTQGSLERAVRPVERFSSVGVFYGYSSASAHTGYELIQASRMYLFRERPSGTLSLVVHHGIDEDATGFVQPKSEVTAVFLGLPPGTGVLVADDRPEEFHLDTATSAFGNWSFNSNTDGGVLGPLPLPGDWSIDVTPSFIQGIDSWGYLVEDEPLVPLTFGLTATLTAFDEPSACRTDCTVPRCGDGRWDGGEVCDDGNQASGDGCRADCASLE
jgi:cysteine-rich repeat protein